ncbi:MAG TPA: LLM class flavin-dependent oxidoreductase, partial [Myxococcota bacterium]|nr:LLM class flavin-dependent oxidoreductase [Myxococcota bacterium]
MRPTLRFGVAYDFRNPPDSGIPNPLLYAQTLEQVALADQLGFDLVWLTEHHFVDDGYLPSFTAVAGAFAARTSRIRISTDVVLAPFHHPLKLAEDLCVLDNLSGGRMELGVGMGYAPHEFRAFGIPQAERVSRTEEAVQILKQALVGEPVRFQGKRFRIDGVPVFPRPAQPGGIPLWLAAQSEAGALRAARFGVNLLPQGSAAQTIEPWRRELRARGADPDARRIGIIRSWLVTDDPERDWPPFRAAERYRMVHYGNWASESREKVAAFNDPGRIPQTYMTGNAEKCAEQVVEFVQKFGVTDLVGWAAPPGILPERTHGNLERFAREVIPRVRARFA